MGRFSIATACALYLLFGQTVRGQDDSACLFLAEMVGYSGEGYSTTSETTYLCDDGGNGYIAALNFSYGYWMDSMQIICSTGEESPWFGDSDIFDTFSVQAALTGGGLTSISAYGIDWFGSMYPCCVTVTGYDEDEGYQELGPYGDMYDANYSSSPTTSDCGENAYAVGMNMYYGYQYIHGFELICRGIGEDCPCLPPDGLLVPLTVGLNGNCSCFSCEEDLCCCQDLLCTADCSSSSTTSPSADIDG